MATSKFFINYRREDSELYAQTIGLTLQARFPGQVFWDREALAVGVRWEQEIERALEDCAAVIVVMGPHWLNVADESGHRRLENENDVLRKEIRNAIGRGVPLVPVLVGDAQMPKAAELPIDLQKLREYNGMWWNLKEPGQSLAKLTSALEEILEQRRRERGEVGGREQLRNEEEKQERVAKEARERKATQTRGEEHLLPPPAPFFRQPWVRWTALGITAAIVLVAIVAARTWQTNGQVQAHEARAIEFLDKRDFDHAINETQLALKSKPDSLELHQLLANIFQDRGDLDAAIAEAREVVRLSQGDQSSFGNSEARLGLLLEKKGDLQGALAEYHKLLAVDPGNSQAKDAVERLTSPHSSPRKDTRPTRQSAEQRNAHPQSPAPTQASSATAQNVNVASNRAASPVDVPFQQLRMTYQAPVVYPPEALSRGIYSGDVRLETWIDEGGRVQRMNPLVGNSPFVQSAESTVSQCTFAPYFLNGQPVLVHTVIDVHFRQQQPASSPASTQAPSQNFQVQAAHRHRTNKGITWCNGVLLITPQGGVSYTCNRPDASAAVATSSTTI
jgi:tetratricopeptide (TPR) repeat protein